MVFDKAQPRLVLQDLLQPPEEVQELFLCKKHFPVTWDEEALQVPVASYGEVGNVVGHVGLAAQWGTRVYRHVLLATKASSFGVAGRTHLVAQRYRRMAIHNNTLILLQFPLSGSLAAAACALALYCISKSIEMAEPPQTLVGHMRPVLAFDFL